MRGRASPSRGRKPTLNASKRICHPKAACGPFLSRGRNGNAPTSSKARPPRRVKPRKCPNKFNSGKAQRGQNQWVRTTDFAPPAFGIKAKLVVLQAFHGRYFAPPAFGIKAKRQMNVATWIPVKAW